MSVGERGDDQVRVVSAEIVKEHGDVVHNAALSIALAMHCPDVKACDMVVVSDFAIIGTGRVEGSVLTATNATHNCIVMVRLLLTGKRPHSAVYLEVFNNVCLPSDELVEKLVYTVFTRKQIELFVKGHDC